MPQIIINNSKSQDEVINDLRENSNDSAHSIIPFIGAGASIILGLPSWRQLVLDYATLIGYPHDIDVQFDKFDRSWAKVSEDIFLHSGSNIDLYITYMTHMHPTNANWQSLHYELVEKFNRIITTNYDFALENAYRKCYRGTSPRLLYFPDHLDAINFQEKSIAYMHGQIANKTFVFRESEYQFAYYTSRIITDFLSQVIKNHYLLFIGFSFDDPIFQEKIHNIILDRIQEYEKIKQIFGTKLNFEPPKCYIILSYSDIETTFKPEFLSTCGVTDQLRDIYFTELNGQFELILKTDIEKEVFFLHEDFKKEYKRLIFNIDRLNYLNSLDFRIILYDSKNRTEIEDILNKICQPESQANEDLPDFS